jgi:hypothetical protein
MKHILFLAFPLLVIAEAVAYDFKHGDLYYNVVNDSIVPYEVEVTYPDSSNYEQVYIQIPSSVSYKGQAYNVTTIGEWAFFNDEHIKHIDVPSSVKIIRNSAIAGCYSLESLHISCGIDSIDWNFFGCPNLQITIEEKNPPKLTLFYKVNGCNTLYVPRESLYKYANAKGWEKFERFMPIGGSLYECIYHPDYDPKNKVASVGGCKFGCGAEDAISFFNNKFKYCAARNSYEAMYVDVNFAGYYFDIMKLQFSHNKQTNKDEFTSVEFQKIFELSEYKNAVEYFESIRMMYSMKYSNEQKLTESIYLYGMIEEEYHDSIPPIMLELEKGIGRDGIERYYLVLTYYTFKTFGSYLDDI